MVGDAAMDEDKHQDAKISELAMRARDLNHRIADIRREQTYQRVSHLLCRRLFHICIDKRIGIQRQE